MADAFTGDLRLALQEVGAKIDLWGDGGTTDLNSGVIQLLEDAIAGREDISVTAGNVTLTTANGASDEARTMFLYATGTPGVARNIVVPTLSHAYVVTNEADAAVTVKTSAGTGISVAVGQKVLLFVDDVLDEVFGVTITGDAVVEADTWSSGTFGVGGETGSPTRTYRYKSQGAHSMLHIEPFLTANCSINTFSLYPVSPAAWPAELFDGTELTLAGSPEAVVHCTDNATIIDAQLHMYNISSWQLDKMDGTLWTSATTREVHNAISLVWNNIKEGFLPT